MDILLLEKLRLTLAKLDMSSKPQFLQTLGLKVKKKMVFNRFMSFPVIKNSDPVLTREIKAACTSSASDVPKWIFDYSLPTSCESN